MIDILYAPSFVRMYKRLNSDLQEEVKDKIKLFRDVKNHTKLRVHKLNGNLENTFSFSVNYKIRVIFEYNGKNRANLLCIGNHDGLYR